MRMTRATTRTGRGELIKLDKLTRPLQSQGVTFNGCLPLITFVDYYQRPSTQVMYDTVGFFVSPTASESKSKDFAIKNQSREFWISDLWFSNENASAIHARNDTSFDLHPSGSRDILNEWKIQFSRRLCEPGAIKEPETKDVSWRICIAGSVLRFYAKNKTGGLEKMFRFHFTPVGSRTPPAFRLLTRTAVIAFFVHPPLDDSMSKTDSCNTRAIAYTMQRVVDEWVRGWTSPYRS